MTHVSTMMVELHMRDASRDKIPIQLFSLLMCQMYTLKLHESNE